MGFAAPGQDESVPIESADPCLICAGVVDICEFDSEVSTADLDGASALRAAACSSSIRLLCRTSAEDSTALSRLSVCACVCVQVIFTVVTVLGSKYFGAGRREMLKKFVSSTLTSLQPVCFSRQKRFDHAE
jgi:hypothetical protein